MLWITRVHYAGRSGTNVYVTETDKELDPEQVARQELEGFGIGDINHVEVIQVQEKDLRNWVSFDVATVLENRG